MATIARHRRGLYWAAVILVTVLIGAVLVDRASAAPAGPPGGLEVTEQNVDGDGYIAVHEQGVADVNVTNGSLDVGVVFPEEQNVNVTNGSLTVNDGAGSISVDDNGASLTVDGTVNVANLPGAATPFIGSTGDLSLGASGETEFTIPAGVVITDLVASISGNGDRQCRIIVNQGEPSFANRIFTDGQLQDEIIQINLTSGWPGPLTVELLNFSSGGVCSFIVTYSGFSTS